MKYVNFALFILSICGLFANCSLSQTNPRKPVPLPVVTPVEPSGVAIEGGRFISKPGGFTVEIPHMPVQTLDYGSEKARAKGIDAGKQYFWKFEKTVYIILYSPSIGPDGGPMPQPYEDMLSGARKGIFRGNGKLISENRFEVGKFTGTELRYVSAQGVNFITRVFLVGDVGYQVQGGYIDEKDQKEVLNVLNSFKSIGER